MWVKTEEEEKKIEKEISIGSREKIGESESKKYCGSSVVEELGGLRWAAGRDLRLVVASPRAAQCKERENEGLKTKKSVHCYTV